MQKIAQIIPETLKQRLTTGAEIALLDVREYGEYGEGHPIFAVNLPYSRLEAKAAQLLPCRSAPCVLLDNGDGVAEKAARRLGKLGHSNLAILDGGAPAWQAAGFTLYQGVNVPSKVFGELVEQQFETPSLAAEDLKAMQEQGESVVVLDGRSPKEFRKMAIPGGRFCPNAELGYRLPMLVPDENTPVVINCAGRTRSLIGAQTLLSLGFRNKILALRNGTQGWRLAGFELVHGATPTVLPEPDEAQLAASRMQANALLLKTQLQTVDGETLQIWLSDDRRTTYLCDVRTVEEYERGHFTEALHAPGGQLVQATDEWVAVRNARIVLTDDTQLRAATTAMWLRAMGHQVWVLNEDASQAPETSANAASDSSTLLLALEPHELSARLAAGAILLDVSPSMNFRKAHITGANWAIRPRLDQLDLGGASEIILAGGDVSAISGIAFDLQQKYVVQVLCLQGGPEEWAAAGLSVVATPEIPSDSECLDYLFFVHDRHDGNPDASRRYLAWELGLVAQLDEQERSVFSPDSIPPTLEEAI